jgi:hypothetical protein
MKSTTHPLEAVQIRDNDSDGVKSILRLLPNTTFRFTHSFCRGLGSCSENCGRIGIYAKMEPLLGKRGVSLIVVDEHLFGNTVNPDFNPTLQVPDGARNIFLVPPRMPPLKTGSPFAGVQFDYQDASFFFGYELSEEAYQTVVDNISKRQK